MTLTQLKFLGRFFFFPKADIVFYCKFNDNLLDLSTFKGGSLISRIQA